MNMIIMTEVSFTASSHQYKAIDTGFIKYFSYTLGSYISWSFLNYIMHMIEICSSAGFPKALGHLNKNSSCTIYYSQQPMQGIACYQPAKS